MLIVMKLNKSIDQNNGNHITYSTNQTINKL